jgi:thioredoxin-dependent peroxiredoxin
MAMNNLKLIVATIVLVMCRIDALHIPTPQQQSLPNRRQFLNHVLPSAFIAATTVAVVAPPSYAASDKDITSTAATTSTVVGEKAPTFTLPNSRGEGATSLDQLVQTKKWTVLYFYPGAFTQGM